MRHNMLIGDFAPKLVELTGALLFDDVWERTESLKRDRSLANGTALIPHSTKALDP